jgi:alpha-tubulin suppressor-like RCC1 family protein
LPVTYQWLKNGTNLINVNSATLVLGVWQAADAGTYQLIATSAAGSVTSSPASLTITVDRPIGAVVSLGGPLVPPGLTNIVAIAAAGSIGFTHSVALHSDGTVAVWGSGPFPFQEDAVPAGLSNVVAIAAGQDSSGKIFNLALKRDGTITKWGKVNLPPPNGLFGVVSIAVRDQNALALKSDGTVVQWGGGTSPPPELSNVVAIAAGPYSAAALRNDGTVVVWGRAGNLYDAPMALNGLTNVVGMTIGQGSSGMESFGMAIRTDGTVTYGDHSGLTNLPGFSNVVAVSAHSYGLALKSDHTVQGYGVDLPEGLTNVIAVSASLNHRLLLISGGPVITTQPVSITANGGEGASFTVAAAGAPPLSYQWQKDGANLVGATNATLSLTNVLPADAGSYTVVAANGAGSSISLPATLSVTTSPGIAAAPNSETVFTGALVTFSAGAVGAVPRTYQWLHDGNVISGATNLSLTLPSTVATDAGSYAVVVSNSYGMITSAPVILALTTHVFTLPPPGTVVGIGTTVPAGLTDIVAVAAGSVIETHSVALRDNGTVVAWGGDFQGKDATVPAGLSNVVAIAAGQWFSLALKSDGTVTSWGMRPVAIPTDSFGVVAISAKGRTALALKSDGTVVQMLGYGPPPVGLSNAVAIAAGGYSSAVVKNDGTLVVWGASLGLTPDALNGLTNVVGVDLNEGIPSGVFGLALRTDTTVTRGSKVGLSDLLTNLPGFSNVVTVSVGNDYGLALRSDSTVLGYGVTLPDGLTNVSAISAGARYSLLITTNPPLPMLSAAGQSSTNISLSTPVFVSGYVLEAADDPIGTYVVIETFTNAPTLGPTLDISKDGTRKYYRLRKR